MPLRLNFGTPSERGSQSAGPNPQQKLQQMPSQKFNEEDLLAGEFIDAYPTRKIDTPVPIEWRPRKKKKSAQIDANTLMNIMLRGE